MWIKKRPVQSTSLTGVDEMGENNKIIVYTLGEIETMLKVTRRTLLSYIKAGKLTAVKIGGKWIVTRENLERFINGK